MKIKVSDYIAKKLVEEGITLGFSIVGGGAMHLNDGFGHQPGLKMIYNHHEQASAIAAESYARITGRPALICVTTGPGGTNAITGVVGGWLDSIPMFVVSGQVRYDWTARSIEQDVRSLGDQEFDIISAVSCMTKYATMVTDETRIRYEVEKALFLAENGRPGPVWLDIPLDVQGAYVEEDELAGFDPLAEGYKTPAISEETAEVIIAKIKTAKRPLINVGNGVRIGNAYDEFTELVTKLGIPVVAGWNSQDAITSDNPYYVGRSGNMGDRPGNFAVANADLLLSLGSRLGIRIVGFNTKEWARNAYVIANDIDQAELDKPTIHVDMKVCGDVKQLIKALLKTLEKEDAPLFKGGEGLGDKNWIETCRMWKEKYPVVQERMLNVGDDKPANVYAFFDELWKQTNKNQIIVVGNGAPCVAGGHSIFIKEGQRFISNSAIASMGYGLPAAIGAEYANEDIKKYNKDVICLTGDGSIQMNLQELETVIFHKLPIKIFVINNGGYHSIRQTQRRNFPDHCLVGIGVDSGDLGFPDMEKLAWAYGFPYVKAEHNSQLKDKIAETLATDGPVICEIVTDIDQNFEPKSSGKMLADGRIVSPPLEDLEPFLSEEELKSNMIEK